jgi:hypothetical protein
MLVVERDPYGKRSGWTAIPASKCSAGGRTHRSRRHPDHRVRGPAGALDGNYPRTIRTISYPGRWVRLLRFVRILRGASDTIPRGFSENANPLVTILSRVLANLVNPFPDCLVVVRIRPS